MKVLKFLPLLVVLTVAAMLICSQSAQAAEVPHHWHISVKPHNPGQQEARGEIGGAPPANLYGVGQSFVQTPLPNFVNTGDGSDEWPCFGSGGTGSAANVDCPSLGDSGGPFPATAAALGTPAY